MIYVKFCKVWIENNKDDTVIITNLYEIKYILGSNKTINFYDKIIDNILREINDEYFSFKRFRNCILLEKGEYLDFDVFALYDRESRIGNLIIIHNFRNYEYNMSFVYDILKNYSL